MSTRMDGKIALVTGAARGIGRGIVERFLAEGATVVAVDLSFEGGLAKVGDTEEWQASLDVGDGAAVSALVEAIGETVGALDVCVSNAGIIHAEDFLTLSEDDFTKVLRVNLYGPFLVGQAVAKQMVAAGKGGSIINMSSINAVLAHANQIPYVTSKGGVLQLTKAMSLALVDKGIRVNAVGPGSIATEMLETIMTDEAAAKKILSRTPMGRLGEVGEIASACVFLATDESSYMTGQTLYVDGGRLPLGYTV